MITITQTSTGGFRPNLLEQSFVDAAIHLIDKELRFGALVSKMTDGQLELQTNYCNFTDTTVYQGAASEIEILYKIAGAYGDLPEQKQSQFIPESIGLTIHVDSIHEAGVLRSVWVLLKAFDLTSPEILTACTNFDLLDAAAAIQLMLELRVPFIDVVASGEHQSTSH